MQAIYVTYHRNSTMTARIAKIAREAVAYVETYVDHMTGKNELHRRRFERNYTKTTLQYFHNELGIQ